MAMAVPRSAEARENALHAAYARLQTGAVAASVDEDIEQWLAQKHTPTHGPDRALCQLLNWELSQRADRLRPMRVCSV